MYAPKPQAVKHGAGTWDITCQRQAVVRPFNIKLKARSALHALANRNHEAVAGKPGPVDGALAFRREYPTLDLSHGPLEPGGDTTSPTRYRATHNAEAILFDFRVLGDRLWDRFNNGGAEGTRWYYNALADVFSNKMPGRLSDRLSRAVAAFSG